MGYVGNLLNTSYMRDFNHTLNVLVKAYLNDTLQHGRCTACAVGNMICDSLNIETYKTEDGNIHWKNNIFYWDEVVCTRMGNQRIHMDNYLGQAKYQIDSTGYSVEEIAKIEFAFEARVKYDDFGQVIGDKDIAMFKGLMAVVDVLADIHGIDLKAKEEAKALFVKA